MSTHRSSVQDELEQNAAELAELKAALMRLHRQRNGRCITCGSWTGTRLRRADWPCPTIQIIGARR